MSSSLRETMAAREAEWLKRNEEINARAIEVGAEADYILTGQSSERRKMKKTHPIKEPHTHAAPPEVDDFEVSSSEDEEPRYRTKIPTRGRVPPPRRRNNNHPPLNANSKTLKKHLATRSSPEGDDDDDHEAPEDKLGTDGTLRYQKARLRILQQEVDQNVMEMKDMRLLVTTANGKVKVLQDDKHTLGLKLNQRTQELDKIKHVHQLLNTKHTTLEAESSARRVELDELRRNARQMTQENRNKEIRLNRALEELEKAKTKLEDKEKNRDGKAVSQKDYDKLQQDNTRLEKQKTEILLAFKKQMKLIDILKRQKIHLEAAKLLSFTEEEFSKTLELGSYQ